MKDLDKLKKQYEKLGQDIERLESEPKVRFKPDDGEKYCYVMGFGYTSDTVWQNDELDNHHYNMGNCYRTKEEAEHARDRQLAYVELIDAIADYNDGWWPDWSDVGQRKWRLILLHEIGELGTNWNLVNQQKEDQLYFKDEYGYNHLIDRFGEDKIKLALGFDR